MDYAAFAGVIVFNPVILIEDFFARPVCRCRNRGFAFATADDFYTAMVDCDRLFLLSVLFEKVAVGWYNLVSHS
jgi:hypothetical protein